MTQFREIERRFRVYKEAPGFESIVGVEVTQLRERERQRERERERETRPRVYGGTKRSPCPP